MIEHSFSGLPDIGRSVRVIKHLFYGLPDRYGVSVLQPSWFFYSGMPFVILCGSVVSVL